MFAVSVEQLRDMEKQAISAGIPEYELMCRAGYQAAAWIEALFPDASRLVFLCGGGNNGGDALVAARFLRHRRCMIFSTREKSAFRGCAAQAAADLPADIPFEVRQTLSPNDFFSGDVIVDGILGIGFTGTSLRPDAASFISAANDSRLPIVALDLPSGIDGDSGMASADGAVNAAVTLTFGAVKTGLFRNDGARLRGDLRLLDIGLTACGGGDDIFTNLDAVRLLPRWVPDCHKNSRGRVLIWGGSPEYPGAAALTAEAALYAGAGIVRCASAAELGSRLCRAAIFCPLTSVGTPEAYFEHSDVLVCGCGWGSCATEENLRKAGGFPGRVIFDADALNGFSRDISLWTRRENVIITPHPGEAARLLRACGETVPACRKDAALLLAEKLGAVTVLKGRDTVVAAPGGKAVTVAAGNAFLATAGSGDVLAGIIGAVSCRDLPLAEAAALGAYIHGIAGEMRRRTLIADELPLLAAEAIAALQHNRII